MKRLDFAGGVFLTGREGAAMLVDPPSPRFTDLDQQIFRALVPRDHYLRRALARIPWDDFHKLLAPYYCADQWRPAESPVLMLKLEFLRYHYNLSDRQVIGQAETDVAFRYFLQLNLRAPLPDPSSLCLFRGRLGVQGFRDVFERVVAQAREQGLVRDRLRLKDATHIIANVAIPTTLALVAQARDKLLAAAEPFDALRVAGERVNIELLRQSSAGRSDEERLVARVTHLREILLWADELAPPEQAADDRAWRDLQRARQLAHRVLSDQDDPRSGDRLRSLADPDVRRNKHGDWYDGYLLDILVDADSQIITQINVLPANGDEAADAVALLHQEEQAHGHDIEALSMDGAGFNGPLLRTLQDPEGLAIEAYVPPRAEPATQTFTPKDFVENAENGTVTCPAGKTSRYRERDSKQRSWIFRFQRRTCEGCALLARCMSHPPKGTFGKTVRKSDYEVEYQRVRAKARTAEYAAVRAEHAAVERKLGEVMNRHGGRRARSRGLPRVLMQQLMTTTTTNVKRIVHLLCAPPAALAVAT